MRGINSRQTNFVRYAEPNGYCTRNNQNAYKFSQGRRRGDLDRDDQFALAIVRLLEIIGEAARSVSEETRNRYESIPWNQIAAARNRLIHGYFDVDFDVVWGIISQDLPRLVEQLKQILSGYDG